MPVVLLERLPLPSLRTYTAISAVLLACAVYYSNDLVLSNSNDESKVNESNKSQTDVENITVPFQNASHQSEGYISEVVDALLGEAWCVWTLINTAYCCLILCGKLIQKMVFGDLRVSEQQHIKDKFWNFVFYKFIFIFGVLNVQNMDEVVLWAAWFSVLGFLHLLSQLCKDRFEYLSFSPTTASWTHAKVLALLFTIQTAVACLMFVCFYVGFQTGINVFSFMLAECVLLGIKSLYVIIRYAIHLWDLNHDSVWENRALYIYYSELVFELSALSVDFAHHLHMLLFGNILLSMASLVICMQLRYLFHEFQRRIRRHKNYLRVISSMEARFPMALPEEMEQNNDDCAICWDKMDSARKLPCGHLFHNSCLRSWLEQDTSCPTCRMSLNDPQQTPVHQVAPGAIGDAPPQPNMEAPRNQTTTNHFFHFDGSRYVSWLPSFSVEVTHTQILGNALPPPPPVQTSQLDNMARQVHDVFPNMALSSILEDLQVTHAVEMTIENILMGNVTSPPGFSSRNSSNLLSDSISSQNKPVNSESQSGDSTPSNNEDATDPGEADSLVSQTEVSVTMITPEIFSEENITQRPEEQPSHINFIQDDNLPDLSITEEVEEVQEQVPNMSGSRFSKSPKEREMMLSTRKNTLMEHARKKYLSKITTDDDLSSEFDDSWPSQSRRTLDFPETHSLGNEPQDGNSDIQRRRELAFQAAQRRMQQTDT